MVNAIPPEEIVQLMRFIAEKSQNVTSPMNVWEICKQFQEETGSLVSIMSLLKRINSHRDRIHEMVEFNTNTKVKMIFALSASIDKGFLIELKNVAEVKVDSQRRIISYKQNGGGLELSLKYMKLPMKQRGQGDREMIQFLAEKSKTTDKPFADIAFMKEFKEKTRCTDSIRALEHSYQRVKETIFEFPGIDKNTKIKMMFISNVKLSDETLKELRKDADVEVDKRGRIIKYKGNDRLLELEGRHEFSSRQREFEEKQLNLCTARWSKICEKINKDELEEDEKEEANWQRDYEKKRVDLIKFLIERTKDVKYPMSVSSLAADFKTKFNSSESQKSTFYRIESFRQRICSLNQFDISTKVKMMFALSAPLDTKFLEVFQKDAFVELDELRRIKTYIANDGSFELGVDHSLSAKANASSGLMGENCSQLTSLTQNLAAIQKGRKRVRHISEQDDDGGSLKVEEDSAMDYDTYNPEDFDYDPSSYQLEMDYIPIENKPESLIEIKTEVPDGPSTSNFEYRYGKRFFDYNPPTYEKDLEHVPTEKKPESLIEVKTEEPSTSNFKYHYEDNLDHTLIEPKPEVG